MMKVTSKNIKIKDVFEGFTDDGEDGVFAYNGKLAIRPPYQREFVYGEKESEAVIQTVLKGFPLNVMYWVKTGDDSYEVLDGQQRTLAIMYFLSHKFSIAIDGKRYYNDVLPNDKYDSLMEYELMVYICEGTDSEKLEWFRVVNIAGEPLTAQELRNSVYTGAWLSDAKKYFSKNNCAAKKISDKYITGTPNRQELLEKALKGICGLQGIADVTEYMSRHKNDEDANELWQYFQKVMNWVGMIFPKYKPKMKGLDWCRLYNEHHEKTYNSAEMEKEVDRLLKDDEIQKQAGIFEYLLRRGSDPFAEKLLNLRAFTERDKHLAYEHQNGICSICGRKFDFSEMQADHIKPWSKGGETITENCQMLCADCNRKKRDS